MAKDTVVFPRDARESGSRLSSYSLPKASNCALSPHPSRCSLNSIRVLVLCSAAEHTQEPRCQASKPVWSRRQVNR